MSHPQTQVSPTSTPVEHHHVCPWWLGPLLASGLRRLFDDPDALLAPFITPGMTVLDFGCAMGFHTLPAARLAGERGRVIAVDVQPRMLAGLQRRAARAGLRDRIDVRPCSTASFGLDGLDGTIDVALAIHVIHETTDIAGTLGQLHAALRPGGRLLLIEPKGHVSSADFGATLARARAAGFDVDPTSVACRSWARVLRRPAEPASPRP